VTTHRVGLVTPLFPSSGVKVNLDNLVRLEGYGNDHPFTNIRAAPALTTAPKLNSNLEVLMFHRGIHAGLFSAYLAV
jgi:hypothetical protein